ncbi:hypothetical protein V502_07623 [Pseudogymnoascus sp. VKM F-4520 (FW-2644)]|nr:hypothetical protein V502_07623 [Pseudogymnoascus sp. VKM F-4520 (FW-2644)]
MTSTIFQNDRDAKPAVDDSRVGHIRLNGIWPDNLLSESFCRTQLASYEVFTLLPSNDDDGDDSKGSEGNKDSKDSEDEKKDDQSGWDGKDGKYKDDTKSKKRERWAKVTINQEFYTRDRTIRTIQTLDASEFSITEKKARLLPNQSMQVTNILDNKNSTEREGQFFEWVLAQLHSEESTNLKTGKLETTSITIYLKRAPLPGIDVIQLYRARQDPARMRSMQKQQAETLQWQQWEQQQRQRQWQQWQQQQQRQWQQREQQQREQQQQQMVGGQYMDQGEQDFVVVVRSTMRIPITSKHDVVSQNYDTQERIRSMPLASEYDSNEQVADKPTVPADEELEVGDALRERRRRSDGSPHSKAASAAAGISARKHNQPLPPIVVEDPNDTVAIKRARNTLAARKSRQRNRERRVERKPITYASQDRIESMPPPSEYDSNQQDQRKTGTSSYWNVQDQNVFPILVEHYGTDYHGIAKAMETKTHTMVRNYFQRQVDSGARIRPPTKRKSTAQMQQQRSRNPNAGQTREPQQHVLGNVGFDFLGGFDPQHQNGNLVQETGQIGIPLNTQQARIQDDYSEMYVGKQNSNELDLAVKTRLDRTKARDATLRTPRSNSSETPPAIPIPLSDAEYWAQRLMEPDFEDYVLGQNPQRTDLGEHTTGSGFLKEQELEHSLQESKLGGHAKLTKKRITAMDEVVVEGPLTDSGYASVLKTNMPRNDPPSPNKQQCPVNDKSNVEMGDEDTEDAKTIYSAATTINLPQSQQYITELCGGIFSKLENHFDSANWSTLEKALPSLIKAFAIKIGHDSSAQVNQDIMYFIHKQHKGIVSHLKVMFCGEDYEQPDSCRSSPEGMSLLDKMNMWDKSSEIDTVTGNVELFEGVGDDDGEITNEVGLSIYHGIVLKSPSYEWLLSSLRNEFSLQWGSRQPRIMVENIRQRILDRLPTGTISKRRPLSACEVTFDLQWDDTMDRQNGGLFAKLLTSEILLSELITVTGCQKESQALTIEQYMRQTWPANGLQLLNVLQKAIVYSNCDHRYSVVLSDNTHLNGRIRGSHFIITAIGPAQFIAECAEQLAWLQAALHSSNKSISGYCAPSIINYKVDTRYSRSKQIKYKGHCDIGVEISPLANPTDAVLQKQSWWHNAVGKSTAIQGFPISRRPEAYPGLELSFELLLSSIQTNKAIIDDGLVLLKGPKLTLQLFKDTDGVFLWRPFHPRDKICACRKHHKRISLNIPYCSIDLRRLRTGRHILGVCTDLLTIAENSEGMSEKPRLPETKDVQHHASRDIAPVGNLRNTAYNPNAINPNGIFSMPPESQDDEKDSRSSASNQVDYSVSKNGLPLYAENPKGHLLLNDQIPLSVDSPSNDTMPSQDESLDSDLLSMSDSSEQFEAPESNAAVNIFINEAVNKLLSGFRSTTQCQFSPSASGNSGQSVTQTAATGSSTTSNNAGQPRKKRRAAENNGDANQDGFPKPPHKKICHSPDKALQRSFACPFLKKDPVKHGKCCTKQLSRIRDVKQHLYRCHIPDFYCQWCLESDFRSEQALEGHLNLRTCPRNNDPTSLDGISNNQRKQLSRKSNHKISEEDQWFEIWEILFLIRPRPSSVYMDTGLSMELRLFREYCDTHEQSVVGDQYESNPVWSGESTAEQRQAFLRMVVARGMSRMFEDHRHAMRSLEELRSRNASFPEHSGDSIQTAQSEAPLSSNADSGIAVNSQPSPRGVSSRRHITSQPPAIFDNREPSAWIPPVDEMMQMPQGLGDGPLDFSNEFLDAGGFDSVDFTNWP